MEKIYQPYNIENCCICNEKTNTVYTLPFLEIFGMAKEYTQRINLCPKCGFIYTQNPFSDEALENRYTNMSKFIFDIKDETMEDDTSYRKRCYRQYYFIKNAIGNFNSVFEVGAASGYNLSVYAKDGMEVMGIEPSEANVLQCNKRYGIDLFKGMFSDYIKGREGKGREKYDLIFLSHVLEHIVNPAKFIQELSEINSKYIFIEVPSLDYKFCDEPFGMFAEEHVNYFTFDNLRNLMKKSDYHIVDANIYFNAELDIVAGCPMLSTLWEKGVELCSLTSKMPPVISSSEALHKYLSCSEINDKKIKSVIDSINDNVRLAVWGTGHHTSRLLGMTNLGRKNIVKFYDSDLRKKGVSYFGKEIMPFNIEDIKSGEVEKVLISTYVAHKSIVNAVRKIDDSAVTKNLILLY